MNPAACNFPDYIQCNMCRLLLVKSKQNVKISDFLESFAHICKKSSEYQGHGWGVGFLSMGQWETYKNISPIWEDNLDQFGSANLFLAHARSAFQNAGISVDNNMPFSSNQRLFIFNGELHGVKIRVEGRIGAEKIFNYINKLDRGDLLDAVTRGVSIIRKRTTYIKAMNMIMADGETIYVSSLFNEQPSYFTMYKKETDHQLIICSHMFPNETDWSPIKNEAIEVYS